jgi:hypothetical protein
MVVVVDYVVICYFKILLLRCGISCHPGNPASKAGQGGSIIIIIIIVAWQR